MFQKGFSMIEAMLVVAVFGVLTAVALPMGVEYNMHIRQVAESNDLSSISKALRQSVLQNKTIPSETTWTTSVSDFYGGNPAEISLTTGQIPRIYVYPSDFIAAAGAAPLPFDQTARSLAGTIQTTPLNNPKVMIISPVNKPITGITSGSIAPALFNAIWTQTGQPANLTRSAELKIEMVNFADVFNKVVLDNVDTVNTTSFNIDGAPVVPVVIPVSTVQTAYVFEGSAIGLYDSAGLLDKSPYAIDPRYYVFNTTWGSDIGGAATTGTATTTTTAPTGTLFDAANQGVLTTWAQDPTCTPNVTAYPLTINNNSASDVNVFSGVNDIMQFIIKVKKGRTWTGNITECNLTAVVPQDSVAGPFHVFYMDHAAMVMNL